MGAMVTIPRRVLAEILHRVESAWPEVAAGHFMGGGEGALTVTSVGEGGPTPELAVVGKYRSRPDGPAVPTAEDAAGLRPGWFLLLVSIRSGKPSEWSCWTSDGKSPDPVPMVVRLAD